MSLRFRKRLKVLPGIYLNIGKNGISATIGPRGANINIGKTGVYLNTGIPGTGISNRQKLFEKKVNTNSKSTINIPQDDRNEAIDTTQLIITSIGLNELKEHLENSQKDRALIALDLKDINKKLQDLEGDLKEKQTGIKSLFTKKTTLEQIQNQIDELSHKVLELQQDYEDCKTDITIYLEDHIKHQYQNLRKAFGQLIQSRKIWDVISEVENTQLKSSAKYNVNRKEVNFKFDYIDFIKSEDNAFLMQNKSGDNFFIYPAFILLLTRNNEIKLIDLKELKFDFHLVKFQENEKDIPSDTKIFDYTWYRINKDGSRDLRFIDNYQIPIVKYGEFKFYSTTGLNEAYYISNIELAQNFADEFNRYLALVTCEEINIPKDISAISKNDLSISDIEPLTIKAAQIIVENQICSISLIQRGLQLGYYKSAKLIEQLEKLKIVSVANSSNERKVLINDLNVLASHLHSILDKIEFKNQFENIDNPIPYENNPSLNNAKVNESETLEELLQQLDSLIGLEGVKKEVRTLINYIKIQKEREKAGLKSSHVSYHCVFTGSPGTGKTTVARIIAKIFMHLGILKKGHLIESDRSGLVAEYVGQTAIKVNKTVNSALDGVLFIDEAYSLVGENQDNFGKEAVATLIKRIEDDRDKLVVILAGYTEEMKIFIDTNPGFKSRFNRYIEFNDYSPNELLLIFKLHCSKHDYNLTIDAEKKLIEVLSKAFANRDKSFGNGRFVRNIFESTLEKQANRIANISDLSKEILKTITFEDIPFN